MELTTRRPKYHQQFWPDHKEEGMDHFWPDQKEEGMDHVDTATLLGLERTCKLFAFRGRCTLRLGERRRRSQNKLIARRVHRVCTRINYKIVPVTNLHKYLNYGTKDAKRRQ